MQTDNCFTLELGQLPLKKQRKVEGVVRDTEAWSTLWCLTLKMSKTDQSRIAE